LGFIYFGFPETSSQRHPAGFFFFSASPTDRRARRALLLPPRSSQVSCNLLESLPDGIGQLMFLEHLDVSGNALVRLPSLSGLKAVTRLDCAGNRLKSLPVSLSGCATLQELCCNNNPGLEWLPTDLGLFQPDLRGVWCNGCALLELPNSLEAATGLVHLDVGRNRLRRLPDSLGGGQQPKLQTVRCGENAITALPAGLGDAVSLRALDASHNALEEVDVLAACATLVDIRLGDNAIASLPRNLAGGPRRLKAQLKALAHASSSSSSSSSSTTGVLKPRVFTGWGDGEWDGLRVFDASGNRLRKIPADLAATLLAGGRTPWRVLLQNNPMQTSIRAALGQPDAEDVDELLRYLDALNDELELMDRAESELGDRARRVREGKLSAECPARIEMPELGVMDRSDRFDGRRHRRFSVSEDAPRVLKRVETTNPGALRRVKPIDEQYLLRCEARKAAAAARARTRWGAAIFSKMKGTNDVKEAAAKLQRRDQLLDAIKRATEEKVRRDEEEFRWIHDVELLRSIPFRLRCQLARSCRRVRCTRGERVYAEGDDGDTAFIVVEGRCQTRINVPKDADEIDSDDESEADLIKTEPNGDVVSGAMSLADAVEDFARRNGRDPSEAEKEGLSRRRHGEKACVGLETLLTGAPRPHSLIAKSQRTVLMEISRRDLARCLAEDDASRAKEHALKVTRAYNDAKRAFVDEYGPSTGASWGEDAAAEDGADAYRESLLETPPAPSVRETLFRAEASRQMRATPGFDAIDSREERDAMVEDYFRRLKVTAHHLGLGLPDHLYSNFDGDVLPWCRTWRANRSVEPPELLGSDFDGSSALDANRLAEWESLRATPLFGGGAGLFLCGEPTLTKAELRHVVSAGCRRVAARQDERPLCLENDPGERGCAYVVSGTSRGDIVRARRPTKFDPNPVPERVGVVKPGDVVCALSLLTGAKATQTVIASTAARAPPKMKALEVNKKCLRAVVMRRPTVLDAMARVVAADVAESRFADDARGVPPEKRAANELRVAHRIANAGWRHYAVGWRTWVRVGSTVRAECRRRIIREKLFGGGAGAFFAAAAGASLDAANDEMIDEANGPPDSETAQRRKRRGELVDLDNSQALGMAKPFQPLIASERAAIAARSTRRVLARAGEVFVQQGHPGNSAFLVLGGSLEALVKKPGAQDDVEGGTLVRVGKLKPGACFGETCLLLGARRAATVRATRDSWLLEVGRRGLEFVVRDRPALADDLARVAAKSLSRERTIGDEGGSAAAAADDDDDDDLGLIDDDARMSSEEHRELVERVRNWVFHGEKPRYSEEGDADGAKAPAADDDGTGLRPTRSRLAFGEATKKVMGVLQGVDCFAALDRTQMLVMLREGADLETHPPGSRVCEQGDDRRDTMLVVMEGELEVEEETLTDPRSSAASGKVDKKVLRMLRRGDVFGESCLFTGAPRGCTVRATYRGATLVELSPAAIAPILRNVDSFVPTVAQVLASRVDAGDQESRAPRVEGYPERIPDQSPIDRAARLDASIRLRHGLAFPGEDAPRSLGLSEFRPSGTERSVIDESLSGKLRNRHPFFRRFTSEELAAVAARGVAREIGTGKHLCRQGDAGETMFIVVSGVAMVFVEERVGERAVKRKVGEVVAGQCFGEECALRAGGAGADRASTIIASPPGVRVVELGAGAFEAAFARRPALVDLAGEYLASLDALTK